MTLKIYKIKVLENKEITPTISNIRFNFLGDEMEFKTGQYLMLRRNEEDRLKPYSISTSFEDFKDNKVIDLCIKRIPNGPCSNYLCDLKEGDELEVKGPFGVFTLNEEYNKDLVFVAGGSGIGPLRAMLHKALLETKKEIYLFYGNKNQEEIAYRQEFEELKKKYDNFHLIHVLSREDWSRDNGYVQDVISKYIKDFSEYDYYVCGVKPMVEDVEKKLLEEWKVEQKNVHREIYV